MSISITWLMEYAVSLYQQTPDEICFHFQKKKKILKGRVHHKLLEVESDEMWSFVGEKNNKQRVWIALEKTVDKSSLFMQATVLKTLHKNFGIKFLKK